MLPCFIERSIGVFLIVSQSCNQFCDLVGHRYNSKPSKSLFRSPKAKLLIGGAVRRGRSPSRAIRPRLVSDWSNTKGGSYYCAKRYIYPPSPSDPSVRCASGVRCPVCVRCASGPFLVHFWTLLPCMLFLNVIFWGSKNGPKWDI